MNIEESKNLLGWVSLNKLYIDTHNECDYHNIHTAIEILLIAYEKEKKKNKKCEYYEMVSDELYKNSISKDKLKEIIYGDYEDLEIILKIKQLID